MTQPDAAPDRTPAVEARGIHKHFGHTHVLKGIDLSVAKGEVVCIIGPSGGGKSTFLRTLNYLDQPDSGVVHVNGVQMGAPEAGSRRAKLSDAGLSRQRRQIGMVFQQFNLFAHMTALENVMCGPVQVLGHSSTDAKAEATRLLALVGLAGKENSYPGQLSGGQQQRVAIARALAMHPTVMLFDEPTSALDPEMVDEVLQVMLDLSTRGMTMIVVTHEIQFARKAAHRIVFMEDGRIIEEGRPQDLMASPRNERTKQFLRMVT
jgi:polar amino acid transport system ATP-binding protein